MDDLKFGQGRCRHCGATYPTIDAWKHQCPPGTVKKASAEERLDQIEERLKKLGEQKP